MLTTPCVAVVFDLGGVKSLYLFINFNMADILFKEKKLGSILNMTRTKNEFYKRNF
jgi:hypothetical protein